MKLLVLMVLFSGWASVSQSQIRNTSWRGFYNLPDPVDAVLSFTNDTASLSTAQGDLLETMVFRIQNDTLFFKKVSGQSSCDMTTEGVYMIHFKENKLILLPISDNCDIRRYAFPSEGLTKTEQ